MALISFSDYLSTTRESSAVTRAKTADAKGLGPDVADVFGHSTPPPWQVERLLKKKRFRKKDDDIQEKRELRPDYSFDQLIRKAASASSDINKAIERGDKEADRIDKDIDAKKKSQRPDDAPRPDKDAKDQETPDDDQDGTKPMPDRLNPEKDRKPQQPGRSRPGSERDRKPESLKQDQKRKVAGADHLTEEQAWLRLLDTSFDRS